MVCLQLPFNHAFSTLQYFLKNLSRQTNISTSKIQSDVEKVHLNGMWQLSIFFFNFNVFKAAV